jgi:hypothetical protein
VSDHNPANVGGSAAEDEAAARSEQQISSEEYNRFVEQIDIASIDTVELHGERHRGGSSPATQFATGAGWLHEGTRAAYRFDVQALPLGEDEQPIATIKVSVVVNMENVPETCSPGVLERFGAASATPIAYPFLREAVTTLAQRLNLPGVVLPMMKLQPDEPLPPLSDGAAAVDARD